LVIEGFLCAQNALGVILIEAMMHDGILEEKLDLK